MTSVAAILPHSGPLDETLATLASLRSQADSLAAAGHELCVHVVDTRATDTAPDVLREAAGDSAIVHSPAHPLTAPKAFDFGFEQRPDCDFILLLGAGTTLSDGALIALIDYLEHHAEVHAVQPASWTDASRALGHHPLAAAAQWALARDELGGGERRGIAELLHWLDAPDPIACRDLAGHVILARGATRAAVGPFDSDNPSAPSLAGWCRRAHDAGNTLVLHPGADAVVPVRALDAASCDAAADDVARSAGRHRAPRPGWWQRLLGRRDRVGDSSAVAERLATADVLTLPAEARPLAIAPGPGHPFVQISGSPRFEFSIGGFVNGDTLDPSTSAFSGLPDGDYFLRVIDSQSLALRACCRLRIDSPAAAQTRPTAAETPPAAAQTPPAAAQTGEAQAEPERPALTSADVEIAPYREGEEHSILALWKRVFGQERDMAMWRWLFADNPAGMHVMLARNKRTGEVVAQFAGMQLRVLVNGEEHRFAQMVDSMSAPETRQSLSRAGVFTDTVLAYVETWGKAGEESFGFGLPNRVAYRIGKRTQGYTDVCQLEWRIRNVADLAEPRDDAAADSGGIRVHVTDTLDPRLDRLWERVRGQFPVMTMRDLIFLAWRYEKHPEKTYRFFIAERAGEVVGFAAGASGFIGQSIYAIGDWMLAEGEEAAGRRLIQACEQAARDSGMERILGSFVPLGCAADKLWEEAGYPLEKSMWKWVGRIYDTDSLDWDVIRTGYYLTLGDSDLF